MTGPARYTNEQREDAFWAKVNFAGPTPELAPHLGPCAQWTGARSKRGEGRFGRGGRVTVLAHRFAYELVRGPIPDGLTIDHLCFNPSCVNPRHLEAVAGVVNTKRAAAAGRMAVRWNTGLTHCKHGHEFTIENTRIGSAGGRHCRTCDDTARAIRTERRRLARIAKYGYDPGPRARFKPEKVTA